MKNLEKFQNIIFPIEISEQLTVQNINIAKRYESLTGDIFYEDMPITQRILKAENLSLSREMAQKLNDFYKIVQGSQFLFAMKDPLYSFCARQELAVGNGVNKLFSLEFLPILSTVKIWVDGNQVFNFIISDYYILEFLTAPVSGKIIEIECEYNLPMRFASDGLIIKPDKLRQIFYANFTLE